MTIARKKYLWLVCLGLLFPGLALAAGISVAPPEIHLEVGQSGQATAELLVSNPTADVQIFEVSADDFEELVTLEPQSFTLEAGETKKVLVNVTGSKDNRAEVFSTDISVVARPLLDARFQASSGVKVALEVRSSGTTKPRSHFPEELGYAAGAVILFWLAYRYFQKKTTNL